MKRRERICVPAKCALRVRQRSDLTCAHMPEHWTPEYSSRRFAETIGNRRVVNSLPEGVAWGTIAIVIFAMSGRWIGAASVGPLLAAVAVTVMPVAFVGGTTAAAATDVKVVQGQTLTEIARAYGTTVAAIAEANDLANPDHILAGSTLQIPSSAASGTSATVPSESSVVVTMGETLSSLAAHYGTTVAALVALNGITNPNHIVAGTQLLISGAAPTIATASATPEVPQLPELLLANPDRLVLRPVFVRWATEEGVSPSLLEAACWWESGWQVAVTSVTGAVGVCQLEPATVAQEQERLGIAALNPMVASDNIEMAAAYLASLLRETGNDPTLALAGYYQGLASVANAGTFLSTQHYVQGILSYVPTFS
jgi:LysM repeat protein